MKKPFLLSLLILSLCGLVSAQSSLAEFDKVRQIRLLQDTRENVRRLLADYKSDFSEDDEDDYSDDFSTENAEIEVYYSGGGCAEGELWNADKLIVTRIQISLKDRIKVKKFNFDFSNYKKKLEDEDSPKGYISYDENQGIAFEVEENKILEIVFFPSKGNAFLLCDNKETREFASNRKQFIEFFLRRGETSCPVANVNELLLETSEILADCEDIEKRINCTVWSKEISIETIAVDPDNDPLTYQYTVSGGKIVGQGAKVIWDLSGLQPGNYTITAAVDDGCGFCGQTQTKTIVVK